MLTVEKSTNTQVTAFELGINSRLELLLLNEGKIKELPSGQYEIFSRESKNGAGEIASSGDFVKLDGDGYPYPNEREYFLSRHVLISKNKYKQIPQKLKAWRLGEPPCPEIEYLLRTGCLIIDPASFEKYYTATLWGTELSADKDAIIVFHDICCNADGGIEKISFCFVAKGEFVRTYRIVDEKC